jgi:thioredoxin-like negative regulator of GroEL
LSCVALIVVALGCNPTERAAPPAANARPMAAEPSRDGWNDAQIEWQSFESGMARARAEHKPVCLVMHADWCPHCRNYSHVFEDPRIVARARSMVMVRVNVDHAPDVANRYQLDGTYVPRTYFLAQDGTPMADIDVHRPQFRYFFDEHQPESLLAAMDAAAQRR